VQVIRAAEACPRPPEGCAITIGFFDGVHVGHQIIVGEVRRLAAELGARSAVVTFDPHPASVVRPESAPPLLTGVDQRLELLAATGVDLTYLVAFDEQRATEAAEDFVTRVLVEGLAARAVVVGADFHFGHRRRGNVDLLRAMGRTHGFEVHGVELVASGSAGVQAVSSTAIRRALADGDLEAANRMLGRPHEVRGTVAHGDRRGRELGYPTANVAVPAEVCLPADGVYAGWYGRPDGTWRAAAISLGRRPQFYVDADLSLLEAHVLDVEGPYDLYGETARVRFARRLRAQERFGTVDELVDQMGRDVAATRRAMEVERSSR
jgi:riboflavin kinase / FMN adenylyltransferase